ncbi:MAG: ATP-binding protein [Candidatus Woesearchaeota archaeon]|nr:MAG: ATP-binding protein [Candidatus Woesearchaeota archaeon]
MLLGTLFGKITTNKFSFAATTTVKKFDYVQVMHDEYGFVLSQIVEVTRDKGKTLATCQIIGFLDNGKLTRLRTPFAENSEVLLAEDDVVKEIVMAAIPQHGFFLGRLDGRYVDVLLDPDIVLTKHLAILAKSGAGKSYAAGVLLEEMLEKNVPVLIFDPHGEYATLSEKAEPSEALASFGLDPKRYKVKTWGDPTVVANATPISLPPPATAHDLFDLLPGKLSPSQQALLHTALKGLSQFTFDDLLAILDLEESTSKFQLMGMITYLKELKLFSQARPAHNEFVKPGRANIINFKGFSPDVQEIIASKLLTDLFKLRKENKIPPFFLVLEEAHNFCPERSFGEKKSSKIIRTLASEGRKFGLGLCVISQRPARIDKSVLSQCSTNIILKVTNPQDVRAVMASVEGVTDASETEIQQLPIGSAMICGVTDVPLFISVRPRRTKHGGETVRILQQEESFTNQQQSFQEAEVLPLIKPEMSLQDARIVLDKQDAGVELVPAIQVVCSENNETFHVLVELIEGGIVANRDTFEKKFIPSFQGLLPLAVQILRYANKAERFLPSALYSLGAARERSKALAQLLEKGYVIRDGEHIALSPQFLFKKLSSVKDFGKLQYESIAYKEKLAPLLQAKEVQEQFAKFVSVIETNECFLVRYI